MGIVLRDYQEEAVAAIEDSWASGINRPAVVIATGGGKTTIFSELIRRQIDALRRDGKRILVLAHREELLEQAEARIKLQNPGIWTAIVKGSRGQKTHQFADVVVASMQTLARPKRREAIDRIGMIIVDECHNAASQGYKDVLSHYGALDERQTPTVGFTATLTRMDGGLPEVWQSVAYQLKIHALIKRGFLVPPKALSIEVPGLNLANTRVTRGDLNVGDIADALDNSAAFEVIAKEWLTQASTPDSFYPHRPTIAFMPNVDTCYKLQSAFADLGVTADVVVGTTPTTDRRASFNRFRDGECAVLIGAMVLTEGFDAPHTSCVIIGRPTLNPGLFVQCTGRGLRLHPESGKTDCLVLDIAGASLKHNLAGVNDLESDCEGRCDCDCLSCGCSDRCKCGIRQCGCRCLEQHEKPSALCTCAGTDDCACGCPGDMDGTGLDGCVCEAGCACRGEGPVIEEKEVAVDVLQKLSAVDILGAELAQSGYQWLTTYGGISFLTIGTDTHLFLLPAPDGGFFQGLVKGNSSKAPVTRLDNGPADATTARMALEAHADASGYTYNAKKASWRRTPASDAQKGLLTRKGVPFSPDVRKGEASNMLDIHNVSKKLDARFAAKYVAASR